MTKQEHELKCWPEFYREIESGLKTFEIRKDDRNFHYGDVLWLREWRRVRIVDGTGEGEYTGREMRRSVTFVLSGFGLQPGFVCMALAPPQAADAVDRVVDFSDVGPRAPHSSALADPTTGVGEVAALLAPQEAKLKTDDVGDVVCQHGTAMDVHCCNCHSGFVFDMAHECPPTLADAAEMLWVVLANVSGGDWTKQSPEWQEAAARYRDQYFAALSASSALLAPPPRRAEHEEDQDPRVGRECDVPPTGSTAETATSHVPTKFTKNPDGDWVCEHGTASDVHCCGCHSGFLFDSRKCVCF